VAPNLREFGLVDPLAWAFVAGVWLATVRRQWWLAALLAAIGVVAKEVVVLAAVAAAAAAWDNSRSTPEMAWWHPRRCLIPAIVASAVLATRAWPVVLVWLFAIGQTVFAARVGADARIPTVIAWSGLAVACALALWSYAGGRLAIVRPAHQVNLSR